MFDVILAIFSFFVGAWAVFNFDLIYNAITELREAEAAKKQKNGLTPKEHFVKK